MKFIWGCKNNFFWDQNKSVGQCWFGANPLIYCILPHKNAWMTSDQKVLQNWPHLKSLSNGEHLSSKNWNLQRYELQAKSALFQIAESKNLWGPLDGKRSIDRITFCWNSEVVWSNNILSKLVGHSFEYNTQPNLTYTNLKP